jgi:succinate dehydrogenase flavin-adding protein (antitoxin of CptAB toxin-antitoxin module)
VPEAFESDARHRQDQGFDGETRNMSFIDATEIKRLRWRSRRGLLELDLVLERYLAQRLDKLDQTELCAYRRLLDLPDTDFLDIVNGKADLDDPELMAIILELRAI